MRTDETEWTRFSRALSQRDQGEGAPEAPSTWQPRDRVLDDDLVPSRPESPAPAPQPSVLEDDDQPTPQPRQVSQTLGFAIMTSLAVGLGMFVVGYLGQGAFFLATILVAGGLTFFLARTTDTTNIVRRELESARQELIDGLNARRELNQAREEMDRIFHTLRIYPPSIDVRRAIERLQELNDLPTAQQINTAVERINQLDLDALTRTLEELRSMAWQLGEQSNPLDPGGELTRLIREEFNSRGITDDRLKKLADIETAQQLTRAAIDQAREAQAIYQETVRKVTVLLEMLQRYPEAERLQELVAALDLPTSPALEEPIIADEPISGELVDEDDKPAGSPNRRDRKARRREKQGGAS